MYLQKVLSRKNCVKKFFFFSGILKVNDENRRIRIQDPDPDPLVRGMDPRIRIRIHPKMSWIRNTAKEEMYRRGFLQSFNRYMEEVLAIQSRKCISRIDMYPIVFISRFL
jgi:hypothetical protein